MRRCSPLLGTYVEVTADSAEAIDAAFAAVARIHRLMSAHDPESEVGRINRFGHREPVEVSDETRDVLMRCLHWWRVSGGRFDVVRAGAEAFERGRIPRFVGQAGPATADSSLLSLSGNVVRLAVPACLDFGGIAKGFAVDQAVAAMRRAGAQRGLVNAGGDLSGFGPESWPVAIVDPATRLPAVKVELSNEALATSAIHQDGTAPHLPSRSRWVSVTVRAPNACDADALTKIVWMEAAAASKLLAGAGAAAFGIDASGQVEAIDKQALAA